MNALVLFLALMVPPPLPSPELGDDPIAHDVEPDAAPRGLQAEGQSPEDHPWWEHLRGGLVIDAFADYLDSGDESGFDFSLRTVELDVEAQLSPEAHAFVAVVSENSEPLEVDEAAVHWVGPELDLKAGLYFVGFGPQMELHLHELPYPDRPPVLAAFLGEELSGTGISAGHEWRPEGARVKASLGLFDSLLSTGEGEEVEGGVSARALERPDFDELHALARVSVTQQVTIRDRVDWGASHRYVPNSSVELVGTDVTLQGLAHTTTGIDFGWTRVRADDAAGWSLGGEALWLQGEIGATADDGGTPNDPTDDQLTALDASRFGFYVAGERELSDRWRVGLVGGSVELPDASGRELRSITAYATHSLGENLRLRLAITRDDESDGGEDGTRVVLQLTSFLGSHLHAHDE